MINLTEAAVSQVREAARQAGTEGMALRLAARRRPDGGIEYLMGFDEAADDDLDVRFEDVKIVMAAEYVPLLQGLTMDYVELEPGRHTFIFMNPNDPQYIPPDAGPGTGHTLG
ncbi:MAG: iron-sulfur cluster assembly accessory protein [Chromatiales bacterium]|nr:iron-sulfur cluster assembly accessory protein [Chromatiales bacterium]